MRHSSARLRQRMSRQVKRTDIIQVFQGIHAKHEAGFGDCKLEPCCKIEPNYRRSIQVGLERIFRDLPRHGLPNGGLRRRFDRLCEEGCDPIVLSAFLTLAAFVSVEGAKLQSMSPDMGKRTIWDLVHASPFWLSRFKDLPGKLNRLANEIEDVTKRESFRKTLSLFWMSSTPSITPIDVPPQLIRRQLHTYRSFIPMSLRELATTMQQAESLITRVASPKRWDMRRSSVLDLLQYVQTTTRKPPYRRDVQDLLDYFADRDARAVGGKAKVPDLEKLWRRRAGTIRPLRSKNN